MNNRSVASPLHTPTHDRLGAIAQARQVVLSGAPTTQSTALQPWLERSWRRCLAQGQRPQQKVVFDPVSAGDMRRAQETSQHLLQAAAPVVRSLARAMADTRYFAILTNAEGVVIGINGPVDHQNPQAAGIARVGVDLSERAVGTTAIGATLAEGQAVWLHRGEHFFDDTGVYSCAGAPVWGPDGRCAGMLDLTGIWVPERPALKHLVTQSARAIENAMVAATPHHLLLRINWPGRVLGEDGDGLVGLDTDGQITAANRAASDMLNLNSNHPWPHCDEVFATPMGALFDGANRGQGASDIPLWCGLRVQVLAQHHAHVGGHPTAGVRHRMPLKEVETSLIRKAVEEAQGNVAEAARALGISRATVYRKLERR